MEKPCASCGQNFAKPANVSRAAWPKRLYCSKACQYDAMRGRPNPKLGDAHRGKRQSPEQIEKRAATYRQSYAAGKVRNARANLGLRREQTSQWKGDDIKYRAAHARLRSHRGSPGTCEHCGGEAREWALTNDAEVVKVEVGGPRAGIRYSPRPSDYVALCLSCHRAYDRERDPLTGRYL